MSCLKKKMDLSELLVQDLPSLVVSKLHSWKMATSQDEIDAAM